MCTKIQKKILTMENGMYYQYGDGVKYVFIGSRNQRGRGIGSFLGGLFRRTIPLMTKGVKAIGKESLNTGMNVLNDTFIKGQPMSYSLQNRVTEAGNNLSKKLGNKVGKLMRGEGKGRSRRRRVKRNVRSKKQKVRRSRKKTHSSIRRGKRKTTTSASSLKRKIVRKKQVLKRKKGVKKIVRKKLSGKGHCEIDIFD